MTSVCILTTVHDPLNTRVFHKEAKSLAQAGFDVTLVAHDAPDEPVGGVHFHSLGSAKTRPDRWRNIPRTYQIAKQMDADVYHFHDPELLPVGVLLSKRTAAKVIYDAHEDYGYNAISFRTWIPAPVRYPLARVFPWVQSLLANRLDAVITTTEPIADQFRAYGHPRVEVVHNYPKTEEISIGDPPIERERTHQLVYVGSLEHIHGLMPMLRLVRRLKERDGDVGLWLLGTFHDEEIETLAMNYVDEHDLSSHVRFTGFVPYEDIFSYLSAADIGLCLVDEKRGEYALSTKIFEYMYAETAVVASNAKGLRPYVEDRVGRLVPCDDADRQAETILELLDDEETLAELAANGKELVETTYNWEQESNVLVSLYDSLLE